MKWSSFSLLPATRRCRICCHVSLSIDGGEEKGLIDCSDQGDASSSTSSTYQLSSSRTIHFMVEQWLFSPYAYIEWKVRTIGKVYEKPWLTSSNNGLCETSFRYLQTSRVVRFARWRTTGADACECWCKSSVCTRRRRMAQRWSSSVSSSEVKKTDEEDERFHSRSSWSEKKKLASSL